MAERVTGSVVALTLAELGVGRNARFTAYGNTTVIWDRDNDVRVLDFVDHVAPEHRRRLLAVAKIEGDVGLTWDGPPLAGYRRGDEVEVRLGATGEAVTRWRVRASRDAFETATK